MVSVSCFSFPAVFFSVGKYRLVEILLASLESGWLSVCPPVRAAAGRGLRGDGDAGGGRSSGTDGRPLQKPRPRCCWGSHGRHLVVALLSHPVVALGATAAQGCAHPSRNTWKIHSTCPTGPNPAWSWAGLHRACVPSIPASAGTTLGLGSRAVGTPTLLGGWVQSLLLPNPRGQALVLAAKPLGMGLGRAPPPLRGCREGDACSPPLLPAECLPGGCAGSGGDVRLSVPSSPCWSLSWGNRPQDPAPLIALSHSPGVRDSQQ